MSSALPSFFVRAPMPSFSPPLPPFLSSRGPVESALCVRVLFARRPDEPIVNGVCQATSAMLAAILNKYSLLSCVPCVAAVVWHQR